MTDVETNKLVTTTSYLPNSLYVIMRRLSRQHITTIELSCEDVGCVPENSATVNQSMKTCKSSSLICDRLASVLFSQRRDLDVLSVVFVLLSGLSKLSMR
jgi:hypothetical protein